MKFYINKIEESYRYNVEHIVRLFYEEPQFNYGVGGEKFESISVYEEEATDVLFLTLSSHLDETTVRGEAVLRDRDGRKWIEKSVRPRNEEKKAINLSLLQVLSRYTGMEQPWGILTGVRPVKLYHNQIQKGRSHADIASELEHSYLIRPRKIKIMERIVKTQLNVIPDLYDLKNEVSIYIGIPFCPTKCAYCTFPAYSIQGRQGSVDLFLKGLQEEIKQTGEWLHKHGLGVTTIYFGGGTPTSISAAEMDKLFTTIQETFPNRGTSRELTVEAGRPDTITPEKIDVMKKWNVDRISINPQSFTEETLKAIGRHHTVKETLETYEIARKMGMNNINMDLIIGLPNEGMKEFQHSLKMVEGLMPESLTVHTLSFKSASTMTQNRDKYIVAGRNEVGEMVRKTEEWTAKQGYIPYYLYRQKNILGNQENVGYALPGKESLYNIIIMEERQTILGLGCGAVSKIVSPITEKITRFANPKEPKVYNENYQEYIKNKVNLLDQQYNFQESRVTTP